MSELAHDRFAVVSSDDELLILVNERDEEVGSADKATCHDGDGLLHRAFSVLLFNSRGELLLQKRASSKRLWGGYWSNSCCSHPRAGESMAEASQRRVREELGLSAELTYLYKFQYLARFGDLGSENELCSIYIGVSDDVPSTNSNEISEWRYVSRADLDRELSQSPEAYTPWFKLEWQEVCSKYSEQLSAILGDA